MTIYRDTTPYAPPGYHWIGHLSGGAGGYRWVWDRMVRDDGGSGPVPTGNTPPSSSTGTAVPPPHQQFSFDTIGQVIFRSIGTVRLPIRLIWVQGIDFDHPDLPDGATTISFAGALCAPIDPLEEGGVALIFDGTNLIYNSDLADPITPPDHWTDDQKAQLILALTNMVLYPGDEAQLPDPMILADKGPEITNAFRRIRYIVVPGYPLVDQIMNFSVVFGRTNEPVDQSLDPVVEFEDGPG